METTTTSSRSAEGCGGLRCHFVVLSAARSGSTLLMDLVNNHPDVKCLHEPLNEEVLTLKQLIGASREKLLTYIRSCLDETEERVVGVKVLLAHFRDTGLTLGDLLSVMDSPKVIILYRPNLLDTFISLRIAQTTNQWYCMDKPRSVAMHVDWDDFREYSRQLRSLWNASAAEAKQLLGVDNSMTFTYDDLIENKNIITQNIFRFLGLREIDYDIVHSSQKQNPTALEKKVQNFKEILIFLQRESELVTLKL